MTVEEFSNEFDTLINNYNFVNFEAKDPNLISVDEYQKSVFLTKAQLEFVKNHYGNQNKYQKGFEANEKRRADLNELVVQKSASLVAPATSFNIKSDNSYVYSIPDGTTEVPLFVIHEQLKLSNGKYIKVIPKTHDEYNVQVNNPFKKPDSSVAWRLDINSTDSDKRHFELITDQDLTGADYQIRYIAHPEPIVLVALSDGLSVDGATEVKTSELNKGVHQEILDRAVELAIASHSQNNISLRVEMNNRNE